MPIWELSFRSSYEYPFIDLSRQVPDTPIAMWCIWDRELLSVPTRSPEVLRQLERGVRKAGRLVDEWADTNGGRVFVLRCTCDRYQSLWTVVSDFHMVDTPPAVYRDGWAYFRCLSFSEGRTRAFFRRLGELGEVELIHKRELPLSALPTSVWTQTLMGDMTAKQVQALSRAVRLGYYASPRRSTTADVARDAGLSRSTFEEHLRKAENRLINALVPYLELYSSASHPAERMPLRAVPVPSTPRAGS